MSIELILEADQRLSYEEVIKALRACGVNDFEYGQNELRGHFPLSQMYFWWRTEDDPRLYAEDMRDVDLEVGSRMNFRYIASDVDNCSAELNRFLDELSEVSSARFVLSYQYETTYVVRDERGLRRLVSF